MKYLKTVLAALFFFSKILMSINHNIESDIVYTGTIYLPQNISTSQEEFLLDNGWMKISGEDKNSTPDDGEAWQSVIKKSTMIEFLSELTEIYPELSEYFVEKLYENDILYIAVLNKKNGYLFKYNDQYSINTSKPHAISNTIWLYREGGISYDVMVNICQRIDGNTYKKYIKNIFTNNSNGKYFYRDIPLLHNIKHKKHDLNFKSIEFKNHKIYFYQDQNNNNLLIKLTRSKLTVINRYTTSHYNSKKSIKKVVKDLYLDKIDEIKDDIFLYTGINKPAAKKKKNLKSSKIISNAIPSSEKIRIIKIK